MLSVCRGELKAVKEVCTHLYQSGCNYPKELTQQAPGLQANLVRRVRCPDPLLQGTLGIAQICTRKAETALALVEEHHPVGKHLPRAPAHGLGINSPASHHASLSPAPTASRNRSTSARSLSFSCGLAAGVAGTGAPMLGCASNPGGSSSSLSKEMPLRETVQADPATTTRITIMVAEQAVKPDDQVHGNWSRDGL